MLMIRKVGIANVTAKIDPFVKLRGSEQAFNQDVRGSVLLWVLSIRNEPVTIGVLIELS